MKLGALLVGGLGLVGATLFVVPSVPLPPTASATAGADDVGPLPVTLAGTGLYANFASRTIAVENRSFTPQYPLWSDGAKKRRFIHIPRGSAIDASASDAWQFPVGTKLWKEFSFGRPVETRFIERTAAGWRFATYVWSEDGRSATLATERGGAVLAEIAPGVSYRLLSNADCRVCHGSGASPVLGFSALQLSVERDPNAAHREDIAAGTLDLGALAGGGWLRGFTGSTSPRIPARTPTERSALGYLHGNCGTCHRGDGALASLGMVLASSSRDTATASPIETTLDRPSRIAPERMRIASGRPDRSVLLDRMRSRTPVSQMPPLGTQLVDDEAVRLMTRWIDELPN